MRKEDTMEKDNDPDKYQIRTKKHQDIIESIFTGTAVARPELP